MRPIPRSPFRSVVPALIALACLAFGIPSDSLAQAKRAPATTSTSKARSAGSTIPVLLVSDIHFDPLHDPAKAKELAAAPVSQWNSILASPASADQATAFASLQKQCGAKGVDTPPALLDSALAAMKAQQQHARFMLLSGDLVVHDFPCRYKTLFPDSSPQDYQGFVLKTIEYVAHELRHTFPGMPVYAALGNNDSGCQDYRLDPNSEFLAKAGEILSAGIQVAEQDSMKTAFSAEGNYSIMMARPMRDTRLIVLNDTFLSTKYRSCDGKHASRAPDDEVAWFKKQLADARQKRQRVWVMGHIPPGIDPYSTMSNLKDVCGGEEPVMFLNSTEIPDLMVEYADEIKLGIFGHTHMDEVRLLRNDDAKQTSVGQQIAVKMTPSVSPVHGNNPSFTVAAVSPESATIKDYTVIQAVNFDPSGQTGGELKWAPEYNYARAYHQQDFSAAALEATIDKFRSDSRALLPESKNYLRSYFPGDHIRELTPFWKQYTCALNNYTGKGYAACVCQSGVER